MSVPAPALTEAADVVALAAPLGEPLKLIGHLPEATWLALWTAIRYSLGPDPPLIVKPLSGSPPATMADFLVMPVVDDEAQGVPERTQLLTWDLRDLFGGLHDNEGTGPIFP
ncbi:MAG: hypothetical protein O6851_05110, partial [Gemmatimonadetes bacterium]|nr:hypothetical protein [Gemmatimonadota bacterium]